MIIVFCFYYIFIFCTVYNNTQISLIKNYLMSIIEGLVTNILITIIIVFTPKIGIIYQNKYIYNSLLLYCYNYIRKIKTN